MEVQKMDIISLPVEYDHKKIDGKFRLVTIAAQRAKELSLGAKPKISTKIKEGNDNSNRRSHQ